MRSRALIILGALTVLSCHSNGDTVKNKEEEERVKWFNDYVSKVESASDQEFERFGDFFLCPCCGYPTLTERGGYDICLICWWEDDGQDDASADEIWGGPNSDYSLTEARENFKKYQTHFRPEDSTQFQRTTKEIELKKVIFGKYDELYMLKDSDQFKSLMSEIKKLEDKLLGE